MYAAQHQFPALHEPVGVEPCADAKSAFFAHKILPGGQFDVGRAFRGGEERHAAPEALVEVGVVCGRPAASLRLLRGADDLGAAESLRRLRRAQAGAVERAHGAVLPHFLDGINYRRTGHAAAGLLRQFDGAAEDVRGDEGARRVVNGDDLRVIRERPQAA